MISLKSPREIEAMEKSGAVLAGMHIGVREIIRPGISSWVIEEFAREYFKKAHAIAAQIDSCSASIAQIQKDLEHDRKLLDQRSNFIPKCENLLSNYWDWDVATRNNVLKELIERVEYSKDTKNHFREGDKVTFSLDIFPRIQ